MGTCLGKKTHFFERLISKEKLGKYVGDFSKETRNAVFKSLVEAEKKFCRPVSRNDVYIVHKETSDLNIMLIWIILGDFVRNDEILSDPEQLHYSVRHVMQDTPENPTGFELFSDRTSRLYPTYVLDNVLKVVPGPTTPTVNFDQLKELLMCKE